MDQPVHLAERFVHAPQVVERLIPVPSDDSSQSIGTSRTGCSLLGVLGS
ncbi:hypothetical protein [Streptomyces sp. NPDC058613]